MKFSRILTMLGINAVPMAGWFLGDWSSGTTLAVYWCETVLGTLFIALRAIVQKRLAPKRGHVAYRSPSPNKGVRRASFLAQFLTVNLMFSFVHAVFLVLIFFILTSKGKGAEVRFDGTEMLTGVALIAGFQAIDFLIDAVRLRALPFRWLEMKAEKNLQRVLLIQMTIMIGMALAMWFDQPSWIFVVFVVLKTMSDISSFVPQYEPDEPPKWLCSLMNRLPGPPGSQPMKFENYWRQGKEMDEARRLSNETPLA